MRNFLSLCKVQLLSFLGLNKILYGKKQRVRKLSSVLALGACILVAFVALIYFYLDTYAMVFMQTGQITTFMPFLICVTVLISFMFSFYSTGTLIYGFKDYDLLCSMPIKKPAILASKLIISYLVDLFISLIVLAVGFVVLVKHSGVFTLGYLIKVLVFSVFCPIFALSVSLIVCAVISYFSSKTKHKGIIQTLLVLVFLVVYFGIPFIMQTPYTMASMLGSLVYLLPYVVYIMNSWVWVVVLVAIILAFASIVIFALSISYEKMHDLLTSINVKHDYVLKNYNQTSVIKCLYKKENKLLFSYPVYISNTIIGSVLGVASLIACGVLMLVADRALILQILPYICYLAPVVICFTCFMSPTTIASISVEGDNFYIVKCAPIKKSTILLAKYLIHLTYNTLPLAIAGAFFSVCFLEIGLINVLLIYTFILIASTFAGLLGLIYNIIFPMMQWDNVAKPVKQSIATTLMVFTSFVMSGILMVVFLFANLSSTIYLIIVTSVFLVCNVLSIVYLKTKGEKLLEKI